MDRSSAAIILPPRGISDNGTARSARNAVWYSGQMGEAKMRTVNNSAELSESARASRDHKLGVSTSGRYPEGRENKQYELKGRNRATKRNKIAQYKTWSTGVPKPCKTVTRADPRKKLGTDPALNAVKNGNLVWRECALTKQE